jgi:hypothetical protein
MTYRLKLFDISNFSSEKRIYPVKLTVDYNRLARSGAPVMARLRAHLLRSFFHA